MYKVLLIGLFFCTAGFGQSDRYLSTISLVEKRVLFWNVKNRIEFVGPEFYDSLTIQIEDGEFIATGPSTGYIIPKKFESPFTIRVKLIGIKNGIPELVLAFDYKILKLPDPEIYLGNINLHNDLNMLDDKSLFENLNFIAKYNSLINHLIGIDQCNFKLKKWTVQVGKIEIIGTSLTDYDHLFAAITNAKRGTEIKFGTFELLAPDGTTRLIDVNSSYFKKGNRNDTIERKVWSLEPTDG